MNGELNQQSGSQHLLVNQRIERAVADSINNIFQSKGSYKEFDDYEEENSLQGGEGRNQIPIMSNAETGAYIETKPTHRYDLPINNKNQDLHVDFQRNGEIMAQPGHANVDVSRRTEKISMNNKSFQKKTDDNLGEIKASSSKEDDNRSYSINSFTNPKIRQTVNNMQMLQNMNSKPDSDFRQMEELQFGNPEGEFNPDSDTEIARAYPSVQAYGKSIEANQDKKKGDNRRHPSVSEEDEDEQREPALTPTQTFGLHRGAADEFKDRSGLKLATYDVWTKDRVRQLLPDKKSLTNNMELVVNSSGALPNKKTFSSSSGAVQKPAAKKSTSQSKYAPSEKGSQVVGIDISSTKKRNSVSSNKPSKKDINPKVSEKAMKAPDLFMKQKDFGAFPQSTPAIVQMYGQMKAHEEKISPHFYEKNIPSQHDKPFFRPPAETNQRATAEFGLGMDIGNEHHPMNNRRQNSRTVIQKHDNQDDDYNSEMREARGYFQIQMEKIQRKRQESGSKSARSIKTSKSSASKVDQQKRKLLENKM